MPFWFYISHIDYLYREIKIYVFGESRLSVPECELKSGEGRGDFQIAISLVYITRSSCIRICVYMVYVALLTDDQCNTAIVRLNNATREQRQSIISPLTPLRSRH